MFKRNKLNEKCCFSMTKRFRCNNNTCEIWNMLRNIFAILHVQYTEILQRHREVF